MSQICIIFEDEHLLVINKPAGLNTHSPSPYAGEGIYEWLKNREPRWANLAIMHRLDKETSGVIVFGKTPAANRSLTQQFAEHTIRKKYVLMTDQKVGLKTLVAKSALVRTGEKYISRPLHAGGETAETHFRVLGKEGENMLVEAQPITGKTHQIRVHAAEHGFPILGDALYGGSPEQRLCLQSAELTIQHPETGKEQTFTAHADFSANSRMQLRKAFIDPEQTNAFRVLHGAADGYSGWYVEQFGDYLLSQSETVLTESQKNWLKDQLQKHSCSGAYHKILNRHVRGSSVQETSPQLVIGEKAPDEIVIRENGIQFTIKFTEGYSVGIFLDQRENRRRFLTNWIAANFPLRIQESSSNPQKFEVLNTFSYTCGFSVCAAKAGARVTSLDLSKKYLEWGKRNFTLNGLNPDEHDFIYGDVFDWMWRLAKKSRQFDAIILDPPTFSKSKESGVFRAEKDYDELVKTALSLLVKNGVLLASTNAATLKSESFLEIIQQAVVASGRKIIQQHYVPQPIDFPINRNEPAYLKTVWLRIA